MIKFALPPFVLLVVTLTPVFGVIVLDRGTPDSPTVADYAVTDGTTRLTLASVDGNILDSSFDTNGDLYLLNDAGRIFRATSADNYGSNTLFHDAAVGNPYPDLYTTFLSQDRNLSVHGGLLAMDRGTPDSPTVADYVVTDGTTRLALASVDGNILDLSFDTNGDLYLLNDAGRIFRATSADNYQSNTLFHDAAVGNPYPDLYTTFLSQDRNIGTYTALSPVPEPTSLVMWSGLGVMGLFAVRRRRKRAE